MAEEIKIIRVKRGTTAQWEDEAAPLMAGEWGYDETTGKVKIGDGSTAFVSLPAVSIVGHNHSGVYEPVFSKNTAFNKNFGSGEGDVCEGNDSRLSDTRDPKTHKSSHATGGGDALSAADIGAAASGHGHSYTDLTDKPTLGTAAAKDVGTSAGNVVELATGGKLPAVDGSQLTNLPAAGITKVEDDTAPKLGGNLNVNGKVIGSAAESNGSVEITPDGTGQVKMGKGAYFSTLVSNGTGNCEIDWRVSNKQLITPSGNRTYTMVGTDGPSSFTLWITVTAARTLYWPASVSWRGGAPAITAAGTYIATFAWNGSDTYIGTCTGKD